jgi:hypothetical protein
MRIQVYLEAARAVEPLAALPAYVLLQAELLSARLAVVRVVPKRLAFVVVLVGVGVGGSVHIPRVRARV